jgi:hypothetical protein
MKPLDRIAHRLSIEPAGDGAPGFLAGDEARIGQHVEMLHDRRQRHFERRGKLAHRQIRRAGKPHHQSAAGRVGKRRESAVERIG